MDENTLNALFADVKNYLDITWADEDIDKKVMGIMKRGMAYLDSVAGGQQDYSEECQARALLLDYVRYVYSSAFEEFQKNYLHELRTLQIQNGGW